MTDMDPWKLGLSLHGQRYDYKELLQYSSQQIVSSETNTWEKEIFRFIINWLSDSPHIIQFSSGTTGKPKEIRLSKESMMQSARNTCSFLNLQNGMNALLCMPTDYIAGKMMIVRSFVCGMNLLITEPKSLPDIMAPTSVDFCAMVPMQVLNLLTCMIDLHPIKTLLVGGAEISAELERLLQGVTTRTYATYGMAETSSHIALRLLNSPATEKSYTAMPGVELSMDERGCLVIQAKYLPGKVISNDLVEITGKNSFKWIGRFDNLINSGGVKIVPEEVEVLIMEKSMLECVALGIPDSKLGEKLVFVFEKEQVHSSLPKLLSDLETFLPRRWKPKKIILVDLFPRNDAMKIDRRRLLEYVNQ